MLVIMIKKWIIKNLIDKNENPSGRSFSAFLKKKDSHCFEILKRTYFITGTKDISERIF